MAPHIEEVLRRDVLFEIVVVDVDAPAAVAPLAGVDVVVEQVREVPAVGVVADEVVREALGDGAGGGDGRDVVAAVGVEVEGGLVAEVGGGGALGEGRRGGGCSGKDGGWEVEGGGVYGVAEEERGDC